jgi:sirohydrochlorin ferrochelatase
MGHGSRVPNAGKGMEKVAARLKELGVCDIVETCYMERLGPHFPETFEKCVKQGVTEVVLIPYFLHLGLHTRTDIPAMMKAEAQKYPNVKVVFGKNLGFDEYLVDLVIKRIEQSRELADVKELQLEEREKYPLPPGGLEFVQMTPEEAEKYRAKNPHSGHHHHGGH